MCDKVNDKRCVWRRYAIIALSVVCFAISYLIFMRQEIRAT